MVDQYVVNQKVGKTVKGDSGAGKYQGKNGKTQTENDQNNGRNGINEEEQVIFLKS